MTITDPDIDTRTEFVAGLRALADWYEAHPDFPAPYEAREGVTLSVFSHAGPDEFADLTRRLGGNRTKEYSDTAVTVGRSFGGGLNLEVYASRHNVCERVKVATKTTVKAAVNCVHCGEPIQREDTGGGVTVWVHVPAEGDTYMACDAPYLRDDADNYWSSDGASLAGQVATPPSFDAEIVEEDVYEWRCHESLLGTDEPEAVRS